MISIEDIEAMTPDFSEIVYVIQEQPKQAVIFTRNNRALVIDWLRNGNNWVSSKGSNDKLTIYAGGSEVTVGEGAMIARDADNVISVIRKRSIKNFSFIN